MLLSSCLSMYNIQSALLSTFRGLCLGCPWVGKELRVTLLDTVFAPSNTVFALRTTVFVPNSRVISQNTTEIVKNLNVLAQNTSVFAPI